MPLCEEELGLVMSSISRPFRLPERCGEISMYNENLVSATKKIVIDGTNNACSFALLSFYFYLHRWRLSESGLQKGG